MKDIIKDYMTEQFTVRECLIYGVAYPLGIIILCIIL
jgi:hypothetical protein